MSSEKLEVGDVVKIVYKDCDNYGEVGVVTLIAGSPGYTTIQIELFDGTTRGFALRTSLKYLGPSVPPEEVLGEGYFA